MSNTLIISHFVKIRKNKVHLNGLEFFESEANDTMTQFLKKLYKHLNLDYPKYFKMDPLCKLAFLAAEIMISNEPSYPEFLHDQVGVVFSNSTSSMDTDLKYFDTIRDPKNYFPSPSLFVYTLPNIMIGEISIRHKMTGENIFMVSEKMNADEMYEQVKYMFDADSIQGALCGWADVMEEQYEAFLFFVKKTDEKEESINFDPKRLKLLYDE